jgi:hypothetical protein
MEIGAFPNYYAGADQSITPNLFSERLQLGITLYTSKSYFRDGLTGNVPRLIPHLRGGIILHSTFSVYMLHPGYNCMAIP